MCRGFDNEANNISILQPCESQHTFLGFKHSSVMAQPDTWDQNLIE